MAIIPAEEKVFMVSNSTNTTYSGSAALKAMQQWYTMEDVTNTVRPYQVFTALLTQSGEGTIQTVYVGTDYGPNQLTIGITYTIAGNDTTDFTNVGAPNNEVGTSFIATGTNPNNQNANQQTYLDYNTGAPVATVLENTIGNIWFTYNSDGSYQIPFDACALVGITISNSFTFINNNTLTQNIKLVVFDDGDGPLVQIYTALNDNTFVNGVLQNTPIEIRVYN